MIDGIYTFENRNPVVSLTPCLLTIWFILIKILNLLILLYIYHLGNLIHIDLCTKLPQFITFMIRVTFGKLATTHVAPYSTRKPLDIVCWIWAGFLQTNYGLKFNQTTHNLLVFIAYVVLLLESRWPCHDPVFVNYNQPHDITLAWMCGSFSSMSAACSKCQQKHH